MILSASTFSILCSAHLWRQNATILVDKGRRYTRSAHVVAHQLARSIPVGTRYGATSTTPPSLNRQGPTPPFCTPKNSSTSYLGYPRRTLPPNSTSQINVKEASNNYEPKHLAYLQFLDNCNSAPLPPQHVEIDDSAWQNTSRPPQHIPRVQATPSRRLL